MTRQTTFILYSLGLVVAHLGVLHTLWDFSRANASASHVVVVPFVALALIYQDRRVIFSSTRSGWRAGSVIILAGLGAAAAGLFQQGSREADMLPLRVGALVLMWIGGFVSLYGGEAFRAARFPLLFLAFMVPLPPPVLDAATQVLKAGSTEAVAILFTVIGTPYHREGFMFSLPTVAIEVADACSGIRSSIALTLTMLLAGQASLKSGWKKAVLVAAVLPVTILKNGIRIVSLSWLAMNVDPRFLSGRLHSDGGIVFFLLSLVLLAPLLAVLRRSEASSAAAAGYQVAPTS